MAEVQIDKGIPVPNGWGGNRPKYPWQDMEVGDSFLLNDPQPDSARKMTYSAGIKYGRKFTCRKTEEGYRVWRVA